MAVLGQGALLIALVTAAWALLAGALAGLLGLDRLARSAGRGLTASLLLLLLALGGLAHALFTDNFAVQYVADHSSRNQPLAYKLSALWAGQGGSLLCWAAALAAYGAALTLFVRRLPRELLGWVYSVLGGVLLFFTLVTVFAANPFQPTPPGRTPADGAGLNPLLRSFWMLIHPPTLYVGCIGCTVPFALAIAGLCGRRVEQIWTPAIRRWTLFAFAFLTLGVGLGAYWAYIELGWGGFWAWDPVENASLMPWLALAALIHTGVAEERRGALRFWSLALVVLTFLLSVYGTFLTRSGIVQSVHAFSQSSIGDWFLAFLALCLTVASALMFARRRDLRPNVRTGSLVSREFALLSGAVVLLGLTLIVFLLTMWPVITELLTGVPITFGAAQFTFATRPFFLVLLLLMAFGPLAAWGRSRAAVALRAALPPAAGAAAMTLFFALLGAGEPWSLAYFFAAWLNVGVVTCGLVQLLRADAGHDALTPLLKRVAGRRRLGGLIAHLSVAVMAIGVVASMTYEKRAVFESLRPGQAVEIDGYRIAYAGCDLVNDPAYDGCKLRLEVFRPGAGRSEAIAAEQRVYGRRRQPSTEVAILSTIVPTSLWRLGRIGEDLYVIPASVELKTNQAAIEVLIHPAINLLWLGGASLLLATLAALWPTRREAAASADAVPSERRP